MKKQDEYPTQVLDVEILRLTDHGIGVAEYYHPPVGEGSLGRKLTIFVPLTIPGDIVQVTIPNAMGRRKAQVHYDKVVKYAPTRNGEIDLSRGREGGVALQYMDYDAQLTLKESMIKDFLQEQDFNPDVVQPILGMEDPYHYRNKMELTFGADGAIGMHEQGNYNRIIDWQDSPIAPPEMLGVKRVVAQWQAHWNLPSYDKGDKSGLLRHLMLRYSHKTGEMMVALFTTAHLDEYKEVAEDLKQRLTVEYPQIESLLWIKNEEIADRTQAEATYILHGRDYIYDEMYGFRYRLWFDTFFQPNPQQAEQMVKQALEFGQVDSEMRVLDLFCGVGTFSLPFAAQAKELAGIEIVETSIESAKRNALDNNIHNTYFMAENARQGMQRLGVEWGVPDLVLLDPPRSGAGGKVMRAIARLNPERIVYVSCNPKSMAEDITWLREFGYELQAVQPIDQFPHTHHTESVALLTRSHATT